MSKIITGFNVGLLLLITSSVFSQVSKLDLTHPEQQKDFLEYLRRTVSLLEDSSLKKMASNMNLQKISDSSKQRLAESIMKDTVYFKKLNSYFDFLKLLESRYQISKFSKSEWETIGRFGAEHGIYFLSRLQKLNEKDSSVPFQNFFPLIPPLKSTDSIPNRKF